MAQEKADLDANEPATAYKLEKAHDRGSIVKSGDLTFAMVLLACVACVYGLGTHVLNGVTLLLRHGLSFAGRAELTHAAALSYIGTLVTQALLMLAQVVFVVWLAAFLVAALQARGVFSAHPLKPDFTRLNPIAGFKRILSVKALHDLWRSALKMAVIVMAVAVWGRNHLGEMLRLQHQSPRAAAHSGIALFGSALTLLAAIVLVFALLDFGINYREFMKKMRMSKRELKDEHKEREGDPRIKKRLRELRMAWLKRTRQLSKIRSADVLLTNPTHYAVALEYRHGQMPAPMITARGAGEFAQRMRTEARRRAVPVVENAPLARALFAQTESQALVAEEHFDAVARVLRWVYAARGQRTLEPVAR